jgi:hypothetical protein
MLIMTHSLEIWIPMQSGIPGGAELIVILVFLILPIAGMWKVLEKANEPGWGALIPIYNIYLLTRVGDIAWWWTLLSLIPYLGVLAFMEIAISVTRSFNRGWVYGIGLTILPFIGWPLLGFGSAEYKASAE